MCIGIQLWDMILASCIMLQILSLSFSQKSNELWVFWFHFALIIYKFISWIFNLSPCLSCGKYTESTLSSYYLKMFAAFLLWQYYLLEPTLCFNSSRSQKGISDNSTKYNGNRWKFWIVFLKFLYSVCIYIITQNRTL